MWTTQQIAQEVAGRLIGDNAVAINHIAALDQAGDGELTFFRRPEQIDLWFNSEASAALAPDSVVKALDQATLASGRAIILTDDVDLALIRVLELFAPKPDRPEVGVHPSAVVDPTAKIEAGVAIGAGCRIGPSVCIGQGSVIHSGVTLMAGAVVGNDCELFPGVVVGDRCEIGDRTIIHPNVVIGADGFGYHPSPALGKLIKVPHIGMVRIGHDVEIGAGTCIDRAKFGATQIGDGCKIDNLCQIAHNCRLGRGCVLAGQVGLAGSVTLGDGVVMGGKVAVKDHVTIGDGAMLAACAAVMNDVPAKGKWGGYPAQNARDALREQAVLRKLPQLMRDFDEWSQAFKSSQPPQSSEDSQAEHDKLPL